MNRFSLPSLSSMGLCSHCQEPCRAEALDDEGLCPTCHDAKVVRHDGSDSIPEARSK